MSSLSDRRLILIVDGNKIGRLTLCQILTNDYDILEADNGMDAIKILQQYGNEISAILLDLVMPVMPSYEFLDRYQSDKSIANIPTIVITQKGNIQSEITALAHGASDFLSRPYNATLIKQHVANIIKLRETSVFNSWAGKDGLTHIDNKEAFYIHAGKMLHQYPQKSYDMLCIDIESFRLVNDNYGDEAGDYVLCCLAQILKFCVPVGHVCRLGGDIFAVILPRQPDYTLFAETVMNELQASVHQMDLKLKFGIYPIEDKSISIRAMCDHAWAACKSIKEKYDKHIAYYNRDLDIRQTEECQMTAEMGNALASGEFVVYYQPKYDLETECLSSAEALVRWQHPQRGFLPPSEFIPLFERNGFITQVDIFVWSTVCKNLRNWIDSGHSPVPISVNLSRIDIYNTNLTNIIHQILEQYDLPPKLLHFEITETSYTDNPKQLISTVTKLKQAGFAIEMDDFGTGYSSLNMLNEVPVDTLKLDMRFMQQCTSSGNNGNILFFIMNLAKWMDISVVAEGIENREQMLFLRSLGCNYGQGYYFAKPMPLTDFKNLLITNQVSVMHNGKLTTHYIDSKQSLDPETLLPIDEVWKMDSIFNRIFNNFIGALALFEYQNGKLLLIRTNESFRQLFGSSNEYVGENLTTLFCAENPQQFRTKLSLAIKDNSVVCETFYTIPKKDFVIHIRLQVISHNTHKTLVLASANPQLSIAEEKYLTAQL